MSSNSRMTRSKGPVEEVSLPPTRMRKDVSTANEGKNKAQGQVQANVQSQQRTADTPSPFARPGSRAGTSTTPASEAGAAGAQQSVCMAQQPCRFRATETNITALIIIVTYERPSVSGGRKYVC